MKRVFVMLFFFIFMVSCASMKPKNETYMGKAVFDIPITNQPNTVVNKVYNSLSGRADGLTKNVAFMPNPLPESPGAPNISVKSFGMGMMGTFSVPQCDCYNSYATMNGYDKGVSSVQLGSSDKATYTACIYPYNNAYRVYIIGNFQTTSNGGIGGAIADGIKKGITSGIGKGNLYNTWFDQLVKSFKNEFPDAKEIEIAMPLT